MNPIISAAVISSSSAPVAQQHPHDSAWSAYDSNHGSSRLELPEKTQKELSKLLEDANLANVISASRLVADRLKFIHGLEALLFDVDSKKLLKERSQLHRMVAENNTWIFGEEFNLTVDDQSLTEVLRKHRKLIGDNVVIDQPVRRIDGKVGIIDLMLSRMVPQNHSDEREHLVVELKRPSVKVGADEITQVKKYAFTVADDERFRHSVKPIKEALGSPSRRYLAKP
jgi:hypothetical protein